MNGKQNSFKLFTFAKDWHSLTPATIATTCTRRSTAKLDFFTLEKEKSDEGGKTSSWEVYFLKIKGPKLSKTIIFMNIYEQNYLDISVPPPKLKSCTTH